MEIIKAKLNIFAHKIKNFILRCKSSTLFTDKKKRGRFIAAVVTALVFLSFVAFAVFYVNDYYHADSDAILASGAFDSESFVVENIDDRTVAFIPNDAKAGLIFYPGGKVEYTAYAPLMAACAERGILCLLIRMPLNLAVLDMNAAKGLKELFPDIKSWYIGGHSLGGSMAGSYLAKNADQLDGLVLLGSYSTDDITKSRVLSVYGSEDGVMNRQKYDNYKKNLPSDLTEIVIDGGNHAGFGMYGEQAGDGKATISVAEQISITADCVIKFILKE